MQRCVKKIKLTRAGSARVGGYPSSTSPSIAAPPPFYTPPLTALAFFFITSWQSGHMPTSRQLWVLLCAGLCFGPIASSTAHQPREVFAEKPATRRDKQARIKVAGRANPGRSPAGWTLGTEDEPSTMRALFKVHVYVYSSLLRILTHSGPKLMLGGPAVLGACHVQFGLGSTTYLYAERLLGRYTHPVLYEEGKTNIKRATSASTQSIPVCCAISLHEKFRRAGISCSSQSRALISTSNTGCTCLGVTNVAREELWRNSAESLCLCTLICVEINLDRSRQRPRSTALLPLQSTNILRIQ